jgi:large subunit ribosomal protein L13Ae
MNRKLVIIDAKGHLIGRLASYVAKQLEQGQKIVIVRCEHTLISGSHYRNKLKYMDFLRKRMSTNPKKGPLHYRAPSRIVHRVIRGMLPHMTPKGAASLGRLKCFDGVPLSLNAKKKVVVPDALKAVRLKPRSRFCNVGDIARECGWTKGDLIDTLETKRIAKNKEWHKQRVKRVKDRKTAIKNDAEVKKINQELNQLGY